MAGRNKAGSPRLGDIYAAKANQIRTVDKQRLVSYRGHLPQEYLPLVSAAIKVHLTLR